jgi:hypothetical protein
MDILQEAKELNKKSFISHVFSSSEEGKAEILNVVQYSLFAIIPVVALNKLIQRFVPEADSEKSSLELLAEILLQLIVMFIGVIIIHRIITYFPTYSGFKYENLTLTNVIIAFLIIILSIQTKLGIKVNLVWDRLVNLWEGSDSNNKKENIKKGLRVNQSMHSPSQADFMDNSMMQQNLFPPAPSVQSSGIQSGSVMDSINNFLPSKPSISKQSSMDNYGLLTSPMAANSLLGGSFGSAF